MTDYGQIAAEVLDLLARSPDMRRIEAKVWDTVLDRIHPVYGEKSVEAYAKTRSRLEEYLYDHLGKKPNPTTVKTPEEYRDWLWVVTEIVGFIRDNPALKVVELELWEWMLNQTYPLPPNHAPTARGMVKPTLENFMGNYGPSVDMIVKLEERDRLEAEQQLAEPPPEEPQAAMKMAEGKAMRSRKVK